MKETVKNRKWVKWAAVGFLIVMLFLTFFSNTIMNAALPQVQAKRVVMGTVTPEISGGGMTESAGFTQIIADTMGEVTAVYHTVGDPVYEGVELLAITPKDDGTLAAMKDQLEEMELQYTRALLEAGVGGQTGNELKRLSSDLSAAESNLKKAKEAESKKAAVEKEVSSAEANFTKAKNTYNEKTKAAAKDLQNANYAVADAEAALANAMDNLAYFEKLYAETDPENVDLVAAEKVAKDAEAALHDAQNVLYAAQSAFDALDRQYSPAVDEAQAALDAAYAKQAKTEESYAGVPDVRTAENEVLSIKDQIAQCEAAAKSEEINAEITDMDLEAQKKAIDEMTASIAEAEKKLEPQTITAESEGVVAELPFYVGQPYTYGDVLVSLNAKADTYALRFLVPVTQAEKAIPGTEGYIADSDGGDYHAVLRSVGPDPSGSANMKELTFDITGYSAAPNLWLSINIPLSSHEYETVIPTQAIYKDNTGEFVYVVDSKSTPFGSRSWVRRVSVEIVDSDPNYAAVEGELDSMSYVVTLSNGPLEDGERVRLGSGGFAIGSDGAVG